MRTTKTMLVFVNTPKNTGLSQISGYRFKGMGWQERDDDDVLGLQPHVPADVWRRRKPDFRIHPLNKEKET